MKLLTAIAVLFTVVAPAAEAAAIECTIGSAGGVCLKIIVEPNHICYSPDVSYAPEDVCGHPISFVNMYLNPPRSIPAPWTIFFTYSVLPVDGPPRGFVAVPWNYAIIEAGAPGGEVPVQLLPGSPLPEERARVEVRYGNDPPLVAELLIRAP